ncbi:MAG: SPOR domain-containing protein [Arenicellales bacterium]|jgi:cell division protein FtsN|nr:SPOR domain-containing protein [Arenicellales bacterium]
MARNSHRKKNSGGARFGHDLVMLVVGVAVGSISTLFYQGATSGDPDRLGAGISQLLQDSRDSVRDSTPASSTVAKSPAPARTSFDFYTVLPEIERVIPETGVFETASAAPKSQSTPAESKSKASPGGFYMLQAGAYNDPGQAERMKARLALAGFEPSVQHISVQGRGDFYRVRVGPYPSMDLMETANRRLAKMKIKALRLKVSRKP